MKKIIKPTPSSSLNLLTTAALVLPGLAISPVQAADGDEVDFQYSHYQESKRDIFQAVQFSDPVAGLNGFNGVIKRDQQNPIEVDSLHGSGRFNLTDRIKFAFNYLQDTWSGATPLATAPALLGGNGNYAPGLTVSAASPFANPNFGPVYLDNKGNIYGSKYNYLDSLTSPTAINNQLTHVMSYASPETRKQGDFNLSYQWDEAAASIGGGISVENDYESRFVNLGGQMDFNQKQTTFNLDLSYTNSDTFAKLDPDALPYFKSPNLEGYEEQLLDSTGAPILDPVTGAATFKPIAGAPALIEFDKDRTQALLRGKRQDWGVQLGLSQVLSRNDLMKLDFGYTRSTGYLANPYKLVYFLTGGVNLGDDPNQPVAYQGKARLEKRPEERNQFNWNLGYQHYFELFDAALHFNYRFAHDDWGINAHTFEADWVQPLGAGWTLTPRIRYYSQTGADFYAPFVTTLQVLDPNTGVEVNTPLTRKAPEFYSSDQRLSGFGALSGGLTIAKQFAKGISLETGFEYYTHQGGLKIGGGGEQDFADYDFWVANAALKVNLEAASAPGVSTSGHLAHHQHSNSPAGVMFDHALNNAGDFMAGYRYMRGEQAGNMLFGSQAIDLQTAWANGCGGRVCATTPGFMTMSMHMLDLMYAPTDWLSLMLMPQWLDMDMDMNHNPDAVVLHNHRSGDAVRNHQSGGIGDTGIYALFKLFERPQHHLVLSLGGTAPTGDNEVKLRKTQAIAQGMYKVPLHYGMQLGSGTWDFRPSLTYTGEADSFLWGAQLTGTKRLQSRNSANFAFGDIFQGSVWGGYQWTDWLATTVRGIYTTQGSIRGEYLPVTEKRDSGVVETYIQDHIGPYDKTANYGGRFWDLGLGMNVTIPHGAFAGNTLKFEWLQPIYTDFNGYQLDRDYALNFTWSYGF